MILPAPCCARQRGGQTRMVGRLVHVAALIVADPHGRANGLHVSRRKRDQRGAYGVRLPLSTECGRRGVGRIGWALKGRRADKTVTRVIVLALAVLWTRYRRSSSDRLIRDTASMRMAREVAKLMRTCPAPPIPKT